MLEAVPGFEPGIAVLQTAPLDHLGTQPVVLFLAAVKVAYVAGHVVYAFLIRQGVNHL